MKSNVVKEKSFAFAIRIVNLYKFLTSEKKEFVLSKQLLRSGTAVGALVREAEQGESKADFVHKLAIALKEANETEYWLELLVDTGCVPPKRMDDLLDETRQLIAIFTTIDKKSKYTGRTL